MNRQRVVVDITSGTIFRVVLIVLGAWFVYVIWDILLLILTSVIIASALEPVVNYLHRFRVPRIVAVLLVYLLLLVCLTGLVSLMIQPLGQQLGQLANTIPSFISLLHQTAPFIPALDQGAWQSTLQSGLVRLGNDFANVGLDIFRQTQSVFSAFFTVVFVFVLALYLVVEQDALKKLARLITPQQHLPYVERTIDRAQSNIGRWVLAQLTLGLIMAFFVGGGLWLLGVKYALLLGIFSGVMEMIPFIGPIFGAVPGVLLGLSQSFTLGLLVLGLYILAQQTENHLLVPNIMKRAIGLNPLVTIIAILLGARLAGFAGVILSVPVATILSVILSDVFMQPSVDDELAG